MRTFHIERVFGSASASIEDGAQLDCNEQGTNFNRMWSPGDWCQPHT